MNRSPILNEILNSILAIAKGDLDSKIEITGSDNELNAIATGLNMLGEELFYSKNEIIDRENKILKSHEQFERVVENISDGVVIADLTGTIIYANNCCIDMFGISKANMGNDRLDDFIPLQHRIELNNQLICKTNGENTPECIQFKWIQKEGISKWFEVRLAQIIEENVLCGFQYTILDITRQKESFELLKESESEKTKLLTELTSRYNELMQFNYIVSHNLRSPIANIIGLSNILQMDDLEEAAKSTIITAILTSSLKMDEMVKDLSVILSARSAINSKMEMVSVSSLLQSIIDILETQINESKTVINVNIANEAKELFTIKSFLQSILYNLLSNAIKYKSPLRRTEITVTAKKVGGEIIISVSDNGIGIDLIKNKDYIFGLYKRFHPGTEGKGLGLNMSKTQVEALGGKITVESQPDRGTIFTIVFPVKEEAIHSNITQVAMQKALVA